MAKETSWNGVVLILVGVVLLAHTLDFVDFRDLIRFWPLLLIAIGVRMVLRERQKGSGNPSAPASGPPAASRPPPPAP